MAFQGGHILLYHGVFPQVPSELDSKFHNVRPDDFAAQVEWLLRHFDLVPLEEMALASDLSGKAAITFDDAYLSVFQEALPFLADRGVPSTVFVNSATLLGLPFWRDKVRYLLSKDLVEAFLAFCAGETWAEELTQERFYRDSKQTSVNQKNVDSALDHFFAVRAEEQEIEALSKFIARIRDLSNSPLVRYGNHTQSHYALSSLSEEQQREEILYCQDFLETLGFNSSNVFAAPFGGTGDVDEATFRQVSQAGYAALAMCRKRINRQPVEREGVRILERYMAPADLAGLQSLARELEAGS